VRTVFFAAFLAVAFFEVFRAAAFLGARFFTGSP
jgi:hypothetical protein